MEAKAPASPGDLGTPAVFRERARCGAVYGPRLGSPLQAPERPHSQHPVSLGQDESVGLQEAGLSKQTGHSLPGSTAASAPAARGVGGLLEPPRLALQDRAQGCERGTVVSTQWGDQALHRGLSGGANGWTHRKNSKRSSLLQGTGPAGTATGGSPRRRTISPSCKRWAAAS